MKILMCKPTYYDIEYEINPWMNKRIKPDLLKAALQWQQLYDTIKRCGVEVMLVEPQKGLPDMVFTANAGLVQQSTVLLSDFRHPERQGEKHYFKQWFIKAGYQLVDKDVSTVEYCFEGEGDALFSQKTLFAGFGIRTDKAYYANVNKFSIEQIVYCELIDPYFYHLDTCFCPLDGTHGFWWPAAFTSRSQAEMQAAIDLFAIPEKEAKLFACNAVVIDKMVIIPAGCPVTTNYLQALGYEVQSCEMSEFIKAGGACKCLTLYI